MVQTACDSTIRRLRTYSVTEMLRFMRTIALLSLFAVVATVEAEAPTTREAAVPPSSVVTLKFTDALPKDIFAELAKQSGAELKTYPRNLWDAHEWRPVSVNLENVSFWHAVKELSDKTGITLQRMGMDRELVLVLGQGKPWLNSPTAEHGPFLVVAQSAYLSLNADLTSKEVRRNCTIRFMVYAEPKVKVLKGLFSAEVEEAVDENGVQLKPQQTRAEKMATNSSWAWSLNTVLIPPATVGERIERLKGSGRFVIQTRSEKVEVEDLLNAKNVIKTIENNRLIIKEVKAAGDTYTVHVALERTGGGDGGAAALAADWNENNLANTLRLVDANGDLLTRRNYASGGATEEQVSINLIFSRQDWNGNISAGEPVKLIWEVPTETAEISVPFEFRDLLLP